MLTCIADLEQVFFFHAGLVTAVLSDAIQLRLAPHGRGLEGRAPSQG